MTLGVGIIAFDRPHYFRRTLASLEQQDYDGEVEYHLFLDGAVNPYSGRERGNQQRIDQNRRLFQRSRLTSKSIHVQACNQGIGLHQCEATEWIVARYDQVMMCEDDVVLSPHWLQLATILLGQFAAQDDVFSFAPGYKKQGQRLGTLRYHWGHWFCEAFTSWSWGRMRPYYQEYFDLIRGVDYRNRDHDAIQALYARNGWIHPASNQDAAKDMAINCAGMRRVCCEVNRAISIGKEGVHVSPGLFRHLGYENQTPYTFDEDRTRECFDEPIDARIITAQDRRDGLPA